MTLAIAQHLFRSFPIMARGFRFRYRFGKIFYQCCLMERQCPRGRGLWKGKLISGRYAQKNDSHGVVETITFIPASLTKGKGFNLRGGLFHHNEIAVDEDQGSNALYNSGKFMAEYQFRKEAAVRHIRQAFVDNWKP
jgi:hypothetical protein